MISSTKYESLTYAQLLNAAKTLDKIVQVYGSFINDIEESLSLDARNDKDRIDLILANIREKKQIKDMEYEAIIKKTDRITPSLSVNSLFLDRDDTSNIEEDINRENTDSLSAKFNKITDSNRLLMTSNEFDKIAKELSRLKKETKLFETYSDHISTHYGDMKKLIMDNLNKRSSEFDSVFRKELIDSNDIAKLNENESYFSSALVNQRLHQHISIDLIEANHQKFLDRIVIYFETLIQFVNENLLRMNGTIVNNNRVSFEPIRNCFIQMNTLRENSQIEAKTQRMYNDILETMVQLVQQIKAEITNAFNLIISQRENHQFDYSKFWNNLKTLIKLKWLEDFKKVSFLYMLNKSFHLKYLLFKIE